MGLAAAIDKVLSQSPFLEEALSDGFINVSSLARHIHEDVEKILEKKISIGAIVMAIHRKPAMVSFRISKSINAFMQEIGDIIVRSGLSDHTFANSSHTSTCQRRLIETIQADNETFCTFSRGVYETTIVAGSGLDSLISSIFKEEKLLARKTGLGSITIRLPEKNTEVSGIYYFLLKKLAWAGINVCEVISTSNEITLVVSEQEIHLAFQIMLNLKSKST